MPVFIIFLVRVKEVPLLFELVNIQYQSENVTGIFCQFVSTFPPQNFSKISLIEILYNSAESTVYQVTSFCFFWVLQIPLRVL